MSVKKERLFQMKQFSVVHSRSANKVGVDGVLVGAWTALPERSYNRTPQYPDEEFNNQCLRVLDAGCGCGLIALMIAQRLSGRHIANHGFEILGIDIDEASVEEASENVEKSKWSANIEIKRMDFICLAQSGVKFDLIVSNPPFYHSGVDPAESERMTARHAGSLSPEALVKYSASLLAPNGVLSLIAEADSGQQLLKMAPECGLKAHRICRVVGREGKEPKRVLMQFHKAPINSEINSSAGNNNKVSEETLIIEHYPNCFTEQYINLCRPFYLKF